MGNRRRALFLLSLAAVVLVVPLAYGALTAPTLGVADDGERTVLVGSQTAGGGWDEGGTVHFLRNDTVAWQEESADSYFGVTALDDGTVLAAFASRGYESGCDPYPAPCAKTGYRIVDPDAPDGPTVVEEYAFPVRNTKDSEVHDVEPLPGGEILLVDMDRERVFAVEDGEITWQWNASDHYTPPADPTTQDWLHMNDVDAINETHYLVSVRNANQLLLLERGEGVVDVVNEDRGGSDESCQDLVPDESGDVRCGDPSVINHQHNPQWLDDGAILVADSENDRIVEIHYDDSAARWEPAWSIEEVGNVPLTWPRDADRLPSGNTLITDTLNGRVVEIAPNGSVIWSMDTFHVPYEADLLPHGEPVGGERYGDDGRDAAGAAEPPAERVPFLTTVLFGLRGEFSVLPHWFSEIHLVTTAVAVLLAVAGSVEGLRAWRTA